MPRRPMPWSLVHPNKRCRGYALETWVPGNGAAKRRADCLHLLPASAEALEVVFTAHAKDLRAAEQGRCKAVAAESGTLSMPPSVPKATARVLAAGAGGGASPRGDRSGACEARAGQKRLPASWASTASIAR